MAVARDAGSLFVVILFSKLLSADTFHFVNAQGAGEIAIAQPP
jgi:hypothetical protein